jgi:hypothetical protein
MIQTVYYEWVNSESGEERAKGADGGSMKRLWEWIGRGGGATQVDNRGSASVGDATGETAGLQQITLEYPARPVPRYGYGKPPHPQLQSLISANDSRYAAHLRSFLEFTPDFLTVPYSAAEDRTEPYWHNGFLPGLDIVSLHGFIAINRPKLLIEVGSGNSTRVAKRAMRLHSPETRLISIDPQPRAEIDSLCDAVYRCGMEDVDLAIFDELGGGDILFVDGSHRAFMNSDVCAVFLDVLPRLRSGVWVQFHDICLPFDYALEWRERFFSEQYLLACYLLNGGRRLAIELPNYYVSSTDGLRAMMEPLWGREELRGVEKHGHSFWVRMV